MSRKPSSGQNPVLTAQQKEFCLRLTQKLYDFPFAEDFRQPVSPEFQDYYKIIQNPMDLGTVLERLRLDFYRSFDKWKDDVNAIWKNALTYNQDKNNLLHIYALELQNYFQSKVDCVSRHDTNELYYQIKRQHRKLEALLEARPKPKLKVKLKLTLRPPKQ